VRPAPVAAEIDARNVATFGEAELMSLRRQRVGVLGAGMLGGPIAQHLGLLRIPLLLVDPGVVEPPNLGNQAFPAASLGWPKAAVRASQIEALAPEAPVEARRARLEALGLGEFARCRVLASAVDSRAARLALAERAQLLGLPWVDAALDGSGRRLLGTVTAYAGEPDAACYACRLAPRDLAAIAREGRPAGCPSWSDPGRGESPPTLSAPAFAAVVAGLAALFVLRILAGRGEELLGSQVRIAADGELLVARTALGRSRACALPHRRIPPPSALSAETLGEVLAAAEAELGAPAELAFPGRVLVAGLRCAASGATRELLRVREALAPRELACTCCTPPCEVAPAQQLERLAPALARRHAGLGLEALGLPEREVVVACAPGGARASYLLERPPRAVDVTERSEA
jgi:molybdopterin/thiamine biosynthesis adenylyltransferase